MKAKVSTVFNVAPEQFRKDIINDVISSIREQLPQLLKNRQPEPNSYYIDSKEVCKILKISKPTLLSYRKKGLIPYHLVGRKVRFKLNEVQGALREYNSTTKNNKNG